MEIKELGHVVLYVRDIAKSAKFYGEVLGWRQIFPDKAREGMAMAVFSSGRTHHELLLIEVGAQAAALPPEPRVGLFHIGLKIGDSDDQLREAKAKLDKAGVRIMGASDHTVSHSLYIADPDGNEVELYIDVPEADWKKNPSLVVSGIKPLYL